MSRLVVNVDKAAQQVGSAKALIPDTCALLDLIRLPERGMAPAREIDAVRRLLENNKGVPRVQIVVPETVQQEWAEHAVTERERVRKWIERLNAQVERVEAAVAADLILQASPILTLAHNVVDNLHAMGERIVASSSVVESNEAIQLAAYRRETHGLGPAKKGKQCIKDCTIAETVLALARAIRPSFQGQIVLLTSNTSDFFDASRRLPHADLKVDFEALDVSLVNSWSWAAHTFGI